jgi:hypothetical protein
VNELISYQNYFLQKINFEIYVNATPTACIQIFLGLWNCDNEDLKKRLADTADIFIADFYCARRSMLFAPSTIAICALIISFSTLRMDCTPWLDCVPDVCLRKGGSNDCKNSLLDIDKCLDIFQRIERAHRSSKLQVGSPTSIACNSEDMDQESPVQFCYETKNNIDNAHKVYLDPINGSSVLYAANGDSFQNIVPALKLPDETSYSLGLLDLQSIEEDCSPKLVGFE